MKSPMEDLRDVIGRDGWEVVLKLRDEWVLDVTSRLSASCRANDGRHQLFQGKIDGVREFFDFLNRKVEDKKKTASGSSQAEVKE